MRVYTPSEKAIREVEDTSAAIPEPDRLTSTGKRIWYTGRDLDGGAGVYFVGAMGANLVKIGWVRRLDKLDKRLDSMRIDCPFPVLPLLTFGPAKRIHESRLHKHFLPQHFHGEWFRYEGPLREVLDLAGRDAAAAQAQIAEVIDVKFGGA